MKLLITYLKEGDVHSKWIEKADLEMHVTNMTVCNVQEATELDFHPRSKSELIEILNRLTIEKLASMQRSSFA